jgi:gluconolactonase
MSAIPETPQIGKPCGPDATWYGAAATVMPHADRNTVRAEEVKGFPVWSTVFPEDSSAPDKGTSMAFQAPGFLRNLASPHPVWMRLVYLDKAPGVLQLRYESRDGASHAMKKLQPLQLQGTGDWKSASWSVSDATFAGGMDAADLRLESANRVPLVIVGLFMGTDYPESEDARPNPNVPHGDVIKFTFDQSRIFPGTTREVTLFVPKQYDGATPACVWVSQDGMPEATPTVLDNLIAKGDVPVMIGIGVTPGVIPARAGGDTRLFRGNRSFEYDSLTGDYVRFLIGEIFPAIEKLKTPDGRAVLLSRDGRDGGIMGASSGGICAFTAAWERPGSFSRVFSMVGSFEAMRNGDRYPGLIRKTEPKAIRVYIQAAEHDINWVLGDWWPSNQRLDRALAWAGYERRFAPGDNGHDTSTHGIRLLPDALRYLWQGWPAPAGHGRRGNEIFRMNLIPGETWHPVAEGTEVAPALAVNAKGEVFFTDRANGRIGRIGPDGTVAFFAQGAGGQMVIGSDGRLYQADAAARQIVAYDDKGAKSVVAGGIHGDGMAALSQCRFYVSEQGPGEGASRTWLVKSDGSKQLADSGDLISRSLAVNPAETQLIIGDGGSLIYICEIAPDGTLRNKQRWISPEIKTVPGNAGVGGVIALDGSIIVATHLGVQIAGGDLGLVTAIVPGPGEGVETMAFGGPDFSLMYVVSGHKLYRRKGNLRGAPPPH